LIILFFLTACGEKTFYSVDFQEENGSWAFADSKEVQFSIEDTTRAYDLVLDLEHGIEYKYQNIYFKVNTQFPDKTSQDQILPVDLADRFGTWYGKCTSKTCSVRIFLQQKTYFNQIGDYQISFEQYSREDPLEYVHALGFKIF